MPYFGTTAEMFLWLSSYCPCIPHTHFSQMLSQHSCCPVVHCCCAGRHISIHVYPPPVSVSWWLSICVCAYKSQCFYSTRTASACTLNTDALFLLWFPYVSMSWLNTASHRTRHKALCRKARQLHSITLTTTGRTHTLSLSLSAATGSSYNQ